MENNIWQIEEGYYKVHITDLNAYEKVKESLNVEKDSSYMKGGEIFAYDITIEEKNLKKVKKILKEFGC